MQQFGRGRLLEEIGAKKVSIENFRCAMFGVALNAAQLKIITDF
jgi:hypothetical protein